VPPVERVTGSSQRFAAAINWWQEVSVPYADLNPKTV